MAGFGVLKLVCVVLALSIVVAPLRTVTAGITCGQVANKLAPCKPYLTGAGPIVGSCCSGVKSLVGLAQTPADKQQACKCLKSVAGSLKGINYGSAAGLPGKCGASIPYKISPSTDCSTVS